MQICIVTPAPPRSLKGNRITAVRWGQFLEQLGHRVTIAEEYNGKPCDLLVALHARKSFDSVKRFHGERPQVPIIVALTGTDLYDDIHTDAKAQQALELASRLIVLQPMGIEELPQHLRAKARVIYQSAQPPPHPPARAEDLFDVCVLGHLRPVKDPFRAAQAARLLPASSQIRITHVGAALSEEMAQLAHAEMAGNYRYRWLGELPQEEAIETLAGSRLLVLTSRMEGGANAISEAIVASVPVISSRISGSIGMLGADYPGYFPLGDTQALAKLFHRAETDRKFYETLRNWCEKLKPLFDPDRERATWAKLLQEFSPLG